MCHFSSRSNVGGAGIDGSVHGGARRRRVAKTHIHSSQSRAMQNVATRDGAHRVRRLRVVHARARASATATACAQKGFIQTCARNPCATRSSIKHPPARSTMSVARVVRERTMSRRLLCTFARVCACAVKTRTVRRAEEIPRQQRLDALGETYDVAFEFKRGYHDAHRFWRGRGRPQNRRRWIVDRGRHRRVRTIDVDALATSPPTPPNEKSAKDDVDDEL